ncbi:MAG: ABC transporter substrate-binding protein [Spirochaetales bacterium]
MKKAKALVLLLAIFMALSIGAQTTGSASTPKTYQKHITIAIEQGITTGDPQKLSNIIHNELFKLTHNRLVYLDIKDLTYHPELAASWKWTTPTVLDLELRKNVKFHNGATMTAADVVYSFERAKTMGTTASASLAGLKSVEATGDYSVRMTLKSVNVDWLDTLALPMSSILCKNAVLADSKEGAYIGTGAWIIKELKPSDYVALSRNNAYWGEMPKTETLTLRYIPEDSARLIALQNGEVDVCINVLSTEIKFVTDDPKLSLVQYNSSSCEYFAFNTSKAPGNDRNLRLALAHAINIDDIITVAAGGLATKAVTNWGPKTFGYYDGFGPYARDLNLAKQYLAKSYPNGGAKLEISVSGADRVTTAQIIQDECKQIGLTVTINEMEGAALTAATAFKTAKHQSMIYNLGWNFAGDDARRPYYAGSNTNKATLTDKRIMELLDKGATEFDTNARSKMYKEIQQINHDEAYYIPLYYPILSIGIKKNVKGIIWMPHKSHDFTYVYCEN